VDAGHFEWDPRKNRVNQERHAIDFTDAVEIFDGSCVERADERFEHAEPRMIAYGQLGIHVIVVVYCWRKDRRRIISARKATRFESKVYWEIVYGNT
jgi:uncharacterized DUF497 family protein